MKKLPGLLALLCTGAILLAPMAAYAESTEPETVDTIYTNAAFYTEDEAMPMASVLAVKDGKIVYVGDDASGFRGETVDLGGAFVTPSFLDAHSHPGLVGTTAWHESMPMDCDTQEKILDYVKTYCEQHSVEEQPYVYFEYYPSELFDENGPKKEWIDAVADDRPVLIEDFSDHACWVNSCFLEDIGAYQGVITANDEDNFIKDENGDYTGWIKEGVWKNYIENLYAAISWEPVQNVTEDTLLYTLDDFTSWGITGVMDACIESEEHVAAVSELISGSKWNGYYELSYVMASPEDLEDSLAEIHRLQETYGNEKCSIDTLKIFYDGTNELGNAALIDGWITDPSQTGYIMMDTEETKHVIERCNEEGIDVHFHMVGDLAFRQVMDATEELLHELGKPLDIQVEVCHCELVDPADDNRPAELGIIVNWTPHWSGGYFGDGSLQYLGEERYNRMYQFNPIIESGAVVSFGSDIYSAYEEKRANPYFSMQIGMTRVDPWYDTGMRESEDAKLSLESLLKGYTINTAVQMRIDDRAGSLTPGKDANFNVYSVNLFDVDVNAFSEVMPEAVVYEGKCISGEI